LLHAKIVYALIMLLRLILKSKYSQNSRRIYQRTQLSNLTVSRGRIIFQTVFGSRMSQLVVL